jgi:hypothetical protein
MGTSIYSDAELDAMSADEAWDKCCYAAWIIRRDIRKHEPMRKRWAAAQEEMAQHVLKLIKGKL